MFYFLLCWTSWVTPWTLEALGKFEYNWMKFWSKTCFSEALPFEWPIWRSNSQILGFWPAFAAVRTAHKGRSNGQNHGYSQFSLAFER